jgi:hypothetical protein
MASLIRVSVAGSLHETHFRVEILVLGQSFEQDLCASDYRWDYVNGKDATARIKGLTRWICNRAAETFS